MHADRLSVVACPAGYKALADFKGSINRLLGTSVSVLHAPGCKPSIHMHAITYLSLQVLCCLLRVGWQAICWLDGAQQTQQLQLWPAFAC